MNGDQNYYHDGLIFMRNETGLTLAGFDVGLNHDVDAAPVYPHDKLTIPATVDGLPVTKVGMGAFTSQHRLKSVSGPESVTEVEDGAFADCVGLENVDLPGLERIGNETFLGTAISRLITKGITSIGAMAFYNCKNLIFITPSRKLSKLGPGAFIGCVILGNALAEIFDGCEKFGVEVQVEKDQIAAKFLYERCEGSARLLCAWNVNPAELTIPEFVDNGALPITEIGAAAFQFRTLHRVTCPASLVHIGHAAFANVRTLERVEFNGAKLETIGAMAFCLCEKLDLTLPPSVRSIAPRAFEGCKNLWRFGGNLPASLTSLGFCAFAHTGLAALRIPAGVKYIDAGAFCGCKELEFVAFDGPTERIASAAFADCHALEEVRLHEGLTAIYHAAFCHCPSLETINFPDSLQTVGSRAFANSPKTSRPAEIPETLLVADDAFVDDDADEYEVHVETGFSLVKKVGA